MPRHSTITPELVEQILFWKRDERSTREIAKRVHRSHSTVWRVLDKIKKQSVSKQNVSDQPEESEGRDLEGEIDHYNPCLASSFNRGLGSLTPQSVVNRTIKQNNDCKDFIQFRQARFALLNLLNEKALDPVGNRFREQLKKRVSSLGFDGSSDNDLQFGEMNDMAAAGLSVIKMLGEKATQLKLSQLADACILYRRPDWRRRLEESNRQLRCTRCRQRRSFIRGKDGKTATCVSCGLDIPLEKARFHISIRKLDPEYVDLVHSAVTSKSLGLGFAVEPRPLTSPLKARIHFGESENEPNSQSSE